MKIIHFQNLNIQNPFNPNYSYYIAEDIIHFNTHFLTDVLLTKEKEIKTMYPAAKDGNTNLGDESVTSRFIHYNLLDFPETSFLKEAIRQSHDTFLRSLNISIEEKYYVQCWFNVLRKGEKIDKHHHAEKNEDCYLGGHICVNVNKTNTYYEDPYFKTPFVSENEPGKITLFPNWLSHYTDRVEENFNRITIAFDIRTEKSYIHNVVPKMKKHWIQI